MSMVVEILIQVNIELTMNMVMEIFTWVCCSRSSSWSLLHLEKVKTFGKDDQEEGDDDADKDDGDEEEDD